MVFGSPGLLFFLLGLPCFICGCIFAKGTWDNWFDYKRIKLLTNHNGSIEDLLASELNAYHLQTGKPGYVVFDDFFRWLDQKKSILDTGNVLDAIIKLETAGEVRREYPEGGGLIIHLLPGFQRRPVFALAPQRRD